VSTVTDYALSYARLNENMPEEKLRATLKANLKLSDTDIDGVLKSARPAPVAVESAVAETPKDVAPTPVIDGNVNEELTADSFFESELVRLREILNRKCEKYYDKEVITNTIQEWRDGLVTGVVTFNVKEEPMNKLFGSKVRMKGAGQGTDGVMVCHGVVSANISLYENQRRPFRDLDYEPYPRLADFNSFEDYQVALEQQQEREINQKKQRERLASLIFVKWYTKDGQLVCQGWHNPETLETAE
jgi:hypothetical protein